MQQEIFLYNWIGSVVQWSIPEILSLSLLYSTQLTGLFSSWTMPTHPSGWMKWFILLWFLS